jgi:hypothetical protein
LPLDDQQRLEMTLRAVETVRRIDPQTPIVATLAQPWGEHMIEHPKELSPMHFADALLRAEGGVSGIGLEWALGYHPRGSMARDLLAVNLHVDRWSQFGLPLAISLVVPSAGGDDLRATVLGAKTEGGPNGERTDQWQSDWAAHLVRLLLAKPSVQAVVWSQWSDATPHDFPHGGLYDAKGNEKPILDSLRSIREQHLA